MASHGGRDPWLEYRRGLRSLWSVYTGRAGRGEDAYTLEAACTWMLLVGLTANTSLLLAIGGTLAWAVAALVTGVGLWLNRGGLLHCRRAGRLESGQPTMRVLSWNVLYSNSASNVVDGLRGMEADLVVLYEPVSLHLDGLRESGVLDSYDKRVEVPGDNDDRHSGIAGYGNEKVRELDWVDCGGMSAIRAVVEVGGENVVVWGFRPEAPTTPERKQRWRLQLGRLAELIGQEVLPVCLTGDMNSSVWHRPYQDVLRSRNLRRASRLRGTWRHEHLGWRARIDHVMVEDRLRAGNFSTGNPSGSDHRPVAADIGGTGRKRVLAPLSNP